jgi:PleD family two-component response regulator
VGIIAPWSGVITAGAPQVVEKSSPMKQPSVPMQDDLRQARAGHAGNGRPRILLAGGGLELGEDAGAMLVEHYEVEVIDEAQAALAEIQRRPPDLVILDGDASRRSSPGLLHLLRSDRGFSTIPVIVLVDQPDAGSGIEGLDARADDFLVRPVGPGELIARVRALLARVSLLRQAEEALRSREQRFARFMENLGPSRAGSARSRPWSMRTDWSIIRSSASSQSRARAMRAP